MTEPAAECGPGRTWLCPLFAFSSSPGRAGGTGTGHSLGQPGGIGGSTGAGDGQRGRVSTSGLNFHLRPSSESYFANEIRQACNLR